MNTEAWLIGIYVQQAICSSFSKNNKYFTKPLPVSEEAAALAEKEKQERIKAKLEAFVTNFNKQFHTKEGVK